MFQFEIIICDEIDVSVNLSQKLCQIHVAENLNNFDCQLSWINHVTFYWKLMLDGSRRRVEGVEEVINMVFAVYPTID